MYSTRSAVPLSRLLAGRINRNGLLSGERLPICDHLMSQLIRRGFKSPNTLHHKKGIHIPFYRAVERATSVVFPIMIFLAYYNFDSPDSFLGNVFGFKQFREQIEDEKDESVRKPKRIKRIFDQDGRTIY